jgi:hypothetical protein
MILLVIKKTFSPEFSIGVLFRVLFKFSLPTLVTNALPYLTVSNSIVDRIIVMRNGKVVESGTYKDLADNERSHFHKYLNAYSKEAMTNEKDREQKLDDFEGRWWKTCWKIFHRMNM